MKKHIIIAGICLVSVIVIVIAWSANRTPAVNVVTTIIVTGDMSDRIQTTGRIEAVDQAVVRANDTVAIKTVLIREGDFVEADTRLIDIDLTTSVEEIKSAKLKLEQARIEVLQAETRLKSSERTYADPTERKLYLERKKSEYEIALIEKQAIEREYQIAEELYDIGSESLVRLKQKEDRVKQAEIKLAQAEKEIKEARQGVKDKDRTNVNRDRLEADYEIALRQKDLAAGNLEIAEDRLQRLQITPPIQGTVTRVHVAPGMMVAAGQPLVTVCDLDKFRVRALVDEIDGGRIRKGQHADIRFEAFPDRVFPGKVSWVSPEAIVRDMRTLVEALILLDAPTESLKIANQVDVEILVEEKTNILLLPLNALYHDPNPFVWRLENDKAMKTPIKIGIADMTNIEVVSGLKDGDIAIFDRHQVLKDRMPVTPGDAHADST